tara:strand:- start:159 stop:896 length:738 start_codon:yes stop_codon:yes gene_type:complete
MELTEDQFNNLQKRTDISFITFTNYGYLHYTKNLILSLEKCNFPLPLKVYCIDQKSFDELQEWNQNITLEMLKDETNTNENIVGWKTKGWNTMILSKLKCIHKELLSNPYVFYTDSDIVFENNYSLQYLIDNLKEYDMCIQQNTKESNYPLNTGFMFIKSNETMKQLFDWRKINLETFTCDQDYINENKATFNYHVLTRDFFPTEYYYYVNYTEYSPDFMIFHFNYFAGKMKKERMINMNKWYLD